MKRSLLISACICIIFTLFPSCENETLIENENTNVENEETPIVSEYVDLGLSVNWATCNIGALKPEEYGDLFAWGENETKTVYHWLNYKWYNSGTLSKYFSSDYEYMFTLDLEDDVAHNKWGNNWRMPTSLEFQELKDNCDWELITEDSLIGYRITSKVPGYTDQSIFLPALKPQNPYQLNYFYANYWTSNGLGENAKKLDYSSSNSAPNIFHEKRYMGCAVRPVRKSEKWEGITSIKMSRDSITLLKDYRYFTMSVCVYKDSIPYNYFPISWSIDNTDVVSIRGYEGGYDITDGDIFLDIKSEGTATITAYCMGLSAKCVVTVKRVVSEYVDLGLSVKWATCNIGSTTPYDEGFTFQWGDTTNKSSGSWSTYKYCKNSSGNQLTKYCYNSDYGYNGFTDNKTVLDLSDDAAYCSWGEKWRIPTKEEFLELLCNCSWALIKEDIYDSYGNKSGTKMGFVVTSSIPGYTDKSIFLPVSFYGTYYWTNSLADSMYPPTNAWCLRALGRDMISLDIRSNERYKASCIRPVCP